jgi:hypothetical protein
LSQAEETDLRNKVRDFVAETNDLLNRTVTDHRIEFYGGWLSEEWPTVGWAGYQVRANGPPGEAIPLAIGRRAITSYLHVIHTLVLDERRYLTTLQSSYAVYADADMSESLFHYDYDRDPDNEYPKAHVQVPGESSTLNALNERSGQSKMLGDLHIPVGGKRYRPSLEDVIEFVIVEGYAQEKDGARAALDEHRTRWEKRQLAAAAYRDPEAALEGIEQTDWWHENRPDFI